MFDFLDGPVRELVVAVYGAIGYVGVALIVALESVVIPIPSELVLPFAGFLVACIVWGVAAAVTGAAPSAYAADNAPPGMNAAAMSTYRALTDAGYVAGPIGLGLLGDLAGAHAVLIFCAVAISGVALAFARYAPESYRRA